jgi:hypothetical protein
MQATHNVAWDDRLESFKGSDTTSYVVAAAAAAEICGVCGALLQAGEPLSLIVDIVESTAADGTAYLTFRDWACHRSCGEPGLQVHPAVWKPKISHH